MSKLDVPYKIYLEESEIPSSWYNVRADMKAKPAPLIHPGTLKPLTFEEMRPIFCEYGRNLTTRQRTFPFPARF